MLRRLSGSSQTHHHSALMFVSLCVLRDKNCIRMCSVNTCEVKCVQARWSDDRSIIVLADYETMYVCALCVCNGCVCYYVSMSERVK